MKFGPISVKTAVGAIVVHAVRTPSLTLKKGQIVGPEDVPKLIEAGVTEIVAARLEDGDVGEDQAAQRLAEAIAGPGVRLDRPFTGRVNLFSQEAGIVQVDRDVINRMNAIDEAVTTATLPEHHPVAIGDMVATVKIIPFATPRVALDRALAAAGHRAVSVAPFRPLRFAVISTILPGLKPSVVDKTIRVMEARLRPAGATIAREMRIAHSVPELVAALEEVIGIHDAVVVFGASATTDRRDVVPAAVLAAGGEIEHFGMPVDPGNLLLLARLRGRPVLGAPGCARSPKENGFDWVLHRILANVPITSGDIQAMGVGGLLMEISTRPQPRLGDA